MSVIPRPSAQVLALLTGISMPACLSKAEPPLAPPGGDCDTGFEPPLDAPDSGDSGDSGEAADTGDDCG